MRSISEEEIKKLVRDYEGEWSEETIRKGYSTFISPCFPRVLEIERIDEIEMFESDEEAAAQAEKDGIKIIRDLIDVTDARFGFYIDTPKNRSLLNYYLNSSPHERLATTILDLVNDMLQSKGIVVPDEDGGQESDNDAALYGMTYWKLHEEIASLLKSTVKGVA